MNKKELIIKLIQQDLRHCQLLNGLQNIGLNGIEKHQLQLFDLVYQLMKVPKQLEMEWGKTYQKYMQKAPLLEVSGTDSTLEPLARLCFKHLKMLIECENREPKLNY